MNSLVFYNLGRLASTSEINLRGMQSAIVLFLGKHFINACKSLGLNIELVDVLEPEAFEKHKDELETLVKYIKSVNNLCVKDGWDNKRVNKFLKDFGVRADIGTIESVEELFGVLEQIREMTNPFSFNLICSGLINIYFVSNGYLKYPIIDCIKELSDNGLINSLESSLHMINQVKNLVKTDKKKLVDYTKSVPNMFEYAITNPVFDVGMSIEDTGLSFATASKVVGVLEKEKILQKISGNMRYRVYKYFALLDLFK